jgi:hypothetical protein
MQPEGSLPHSKLPAKCLYPEPAQSSPYPTSQFLKIRLNIILPSTPGSPQWYISHRFHHQNPGFCNVWVCVWVFVSVGVCMCGFCNVWVCVCVGFVMRVSFGNVYLYLLCFVLSVLCFCIVSFMCMFSYLFCLYCHRVTIQLQLVIIIIYIYIYVVVCFVCFCLIL